MKQIETNEGALVRAGGAVPALAEGLWRPVRRPEPEFGVTDYLKALWRRKWLVGALAVVGLGLGAVYTYSQAPVYQALTLVEVLGTNEDFLSTKEVSPFSLGRETGMDAAIQTQVEIAQSEATVKRVLAKLRETGWDLESPGTPRLDWRRLAGKDKPEDHAPRQLTPAEALKRLTVRSGAPSRLIRVTAESTDAAFAARLANGLAAEAAEMNAESRVAATRRTSEFLTSQVEAVRRSLEKAENELNAYARTSGLTMNESSESVDQQKLRQLQEELSRAQAERLAKESQLAPAGAGKTEWMPQAAASPTLPSYEMKLTELRRELAELRAMYTPAHHRVKQVEAQIRELETAVARESTAVERRLQNEHRTALGREKMLESAYQRQSALVNEQSAKMVHYLTLKREVDTSRTFHAALTQRLREATIASAIRPSDVRVAVPASEPQHPVRPKNSLNLGLGLFAGLVLGIALAVLAEQMDETIKTPGESAGMLDLPELGAIPLTRGDLFSSLAGRNFVAELSAWRSGASGVAESFRQTVVSLIPGQGANPASRVIVVTSPSGGEGKTMVAANLAIVLAGSDRRVLLIDGNLRRPRLDGLFGLPAPEGLAQLLDPASLSAEDVSELVYLTQVPNLYVLAAGHAGADANSLLRAHRLAEVLNSLRQDFDVILIDAPAALDWADARVLAKTADGAIVVLRAGQTRVTEAMAACRRLLMDGVMIVGTVLNGWEPGSRRSGWRFLPLGLLRVLGGWWPRRVSGEPLNERREGAAA